MDKVVKKIVMICQTPPPLHGQAMMGKYLLEGNYQNIHLIHIRMAFSHTSDETGRVSFAKVFHLIGILFRLLWYRSITGASIVYYATSICAHEESGMSRNAFFKDAIILSVARVIYRKAIFHFHALGLNYIYRTKGKLYRWLTRRFFFKPDLSIVLTSFAEQDILHLKSKKVIVLPNGIPDWYEEKKSLKVTRRVNPKFSILYVGLLSKMKGIDLILGAAKQLKEAGNKHFQFLLVGRFVSEAFQRYCEHFIEEHNLCSYIKFCGEMKGEAKHQLYAHANLFCMPSRHESFGVVNLEAMMHGLPIVYSDIPSFRSYLSSKVGYSFSSGQPNSLAHSINLAMQRTGLLNQKGTNGRRLFEAHYSLQTLQSNFSMILRDI